MVAVSIMWGFIFDTSGIINTALKEWKVISMPLGFLSDKKHGHDMFNVYYYLAGTWLLYDDVSGRFTGDSSGTL